GRGPATTGDRKARAWLVEQLQTLGYEAGFGAGNYEQPVDIVGIASQMPRHWNFRSTGRNGVTLALEHGEQFTGVGGLQQPQVAIRNAEVVFVGYGIQAPEFQWDDFKGQDLRGKILLMLNNDPDWDEKLFAGPMRLYYGRWMYKYESAARQGAAGAIIIHTTPSAGYPWQVVRTSWGGEQFELPAGDEPRIQVKGWVTEEAAAQLAALGGKDLAQLIATAKSRDFQPVALGVQTSLAFTNTIAKKSTANVAGLLRGSDPQLAREVVVYTAHHDHLGIGEPDKSGDRIYNGAIDNASGVAQVLALARAFKALPTPPRRSVLMLFVAAEEQGLLGSQYYAEHPTFEPGRIAANINFDTANLYGAAADLVFVGKGKSTLDAVVEKYAATQHRKVKPDQMIDRGFFYRSDQLNFARIGVPAFYMHRAMEFVGKPAGWGKQQYEDYEAQRYHQPGDEFDLNWNYAGIIADTRLAFWVGLDIANADALPAWNAGDEFEAARKAAVAALSGADHPN
ncbi:MAG: M20/M25/M40 family metallo-hydrolase, partial [Pseudomonadota bacterium]